VDVCDNHLEARRAGMERIALALFADPHRILAASASLHENGCPEWASVFDFGCGIL
jgi:hypothetical protein